MSLISPWSPVIEKADEPESTQKHEPRLKEDSGESNLEPTEWPWPRDMDLPQISHSNAEAVWRTFIVTEQRTGYIKACFRYTGEK